MTIASLQFDVASAPVVPRLPINGIRRDGGTQMRVDLNQEAVDAYAERYEAGDIFPSIVVFYDGKAHWLADGFHRIAAVAKLAARSIGTDKHERWANIACDVRAGTLSDAVRFAIGANKKNGLRRTNADKQMAVRAALSHPEMQRMSDQAIADEAGVSAFMVRQHRQVQENRTSTQQSKIFTKTDEVSRTRVGTDGKTYPVKDKTKPPGRPPKRTPRERQEYDRLRMAERRAAERGESQTKRICPMCNGKGHLND